MENTEGILRRLKESGNYRELHTVTPYGSRITVRGRSYLNMSSNDYLGLSVDAALQQEFMESIAGYGGFLMGTPASRLITGNNTHYGELESTLGGLYGGSPCLVLSSGYAVNTGVLPAVTSKSDVILADKLVHASIIDGLKLCSCEWARFNHNDMGHLETLLLKARNRTKGGNIWIVTESVFSMDGDRAPLAEITALKEKYGARLYIDEAHSFGVFGDNGEGLSYEAGALADNDILIATLGKAAASTGAFIICNGKTRELLINRMRTLIFSTALPPVNLMWSRFVAERMPAFGGRRRHLKKLIGIISPGNAGATQVIPVMARGNAGALALAEELRNEGFWTTAIRYPTVPKGKERIRLSLTASMTEDDIKKFISVCRPVG